MALEVIVLAAGLGTRMRSASPKPLHEVAGKPMLGWVIEAAEALDPRCIHVVVGPSHAATRAAFDRHARVNFVTQPEQLGTGHAVLQVLPQLDKDSRVMMLFGDVPLVQASSLKRLVDQTPAAGLGVMTVVLDDPSGLGRIVRDAEGSVVDIREHKDASGEERTIKEINGGIMIAPSTCLQRWLPALQPNNAQGELYLTDIVAMAAKEGTAVGTASPTSATELGGINDRAQLAAAERIAQRRIADRLMSEGVTLRDPARLDVRGTLIAGRDTIVDVNVVFEGDVTLGEGVSIGPHCYIKDAVIGDFARIEPNTVIDGARVGAEASIGPFARLRPGTDLGERVKIGNFVETKKAVLGAGAKASHLAYLGDTNIGSESNIGAGTITCNYDGVNKHRTEIGEAVFVGSNSTLVAPIQIDAGAFIAAGSTVTSKVPSHSLAVGRARQRNIDGWKHPADRQQKDEG